MEAPLITSDSGGATATLGIAESTSVVTTVTATDVDTSTALSYSISGGIDAALFQINAITGALSFIAAPNFETPTDAGADNVYDVIVQVSDGILTDTQAIAVTVTDVKEAPAITSNGGDQPPEFVSRIDGPAFQRQTATVALADGGWIQLWVYSGIFAQRFDYTGAAVGGTFQVNTTPFSSAVRGSVSATSLTSGGWVATWTWPARVGSGFGIDAEGDIRGQVYSPTGAPVGPQLSVNSSSNFDQNNPTVTSLTGGDWVVTWQSKNQDGFGYGIFSQLYGPNGKKNIEQQVNTQTYDDQINPSVAGNPNGGWVVVWETKQDTGYPAIVFQVFDQTGAKIGGETPISTPQIDIHNLSPSVCILADGNLAVAWTAFDQSDQSYVLIYQLLDLSGNILKPATEVPGSFATKLITPETVLLPSGDWLLTWSSVDPVNQSNSVYVQRFDSIGGLIGSPIKINEIAQTSGSNPSIAVLADGGWMSTWIGDDGAIYGVHFDAAGRRVALAQGFGETALDVAENTTAVTTVTATDGDASTTLSYSISGGVDVALFQINVATGALSFITAPNFEAPTDVGANNVYDVVVQVSDGTLTDTQAIAVTVTDVDEIAPTLLSASPVDGAIGFSASGNVAFTFSEAVQRGTGVIELRAGSAAGTVVESFDAANSARITISGETLTIDPTAVLGSNTRYFVTIPSGAIRDIAGNAYAGVTTYDFTTAYNLVTGTASTDVLTGTASDDQISGLAGNDTLRGNAGNDLIAGGAGVDLAIYSTSLAQAQVTRNADKSLAITTSLDGTDTVTGVEQFRFSDGLYSFTFRNPGPAVIANFNAASGWSSQDQFPRHVADMNGDGYADVVGFGFAGTFVSYGSALGTFSGATLVLSNFGQTAGWTSDNQFHREVVDVNGDGRADIVGFGQAGTLVSLARSDGSFADPILGVANFGVSQGWTTQDGFARTLGDVNGDGFVDIVGFGAAGTLVSLGNGNGTFQQVRTGIANFGVSQGWSSDNRYHRAVADVTGDGRDDLIGFGIGGTFVAVSRGDGTFNSAQLVLNDFGANQGWSSDDRFPRLVADVNGDAVADIVGFGIAGTLISFGKGDGTFSDASFDLANFGANQGWNSDNAYHRTIADMNNDGLADIVGFGIAGVLVGLNDGTILL